MLSFLYPMSRFIWSETHAPHSKSVTWETMLLDWQRSSDNIFINGQAFTSLVGDKKPIEIIPFIRLLIRSMALTENRDAVNTSPLKDMLSTHQIGKETYHLPYKDFMAYLFDSPLSSANQQALIDLELERQVLILEELFEGEEFDIRPYTFALLHLRLACFQGGRQDDVPSALSLRLAEKKWSGRFSDKTYHLKTTEAGFILSTTAALTQLFDSMGQPIKRTDRCGKSSPYLSINSQFCFSAITTSRALINTKTELKTAISPLRALVAQESPEEKCLKKLDRARNTSALKKLKDDEQLLELSAQYIAGDLSDEHFALCLARYTSRCKLATQVLVRDIVSALPLETQLSIQQATIRHMIAIETSQTCLTDIAKLSALQQQLTTVVQLESTYRSNQLSFSRGLPLNLLDTISLCHQQCIRKLSA